MKNKIDNYVNRIICGDCIKVMNKIPSETLDMIIYSPPYNISVSYDGYNDNLSHNEYIDFMRQVIIEDYRLLKPDGRLAINIAHVLSDLKDNSSKQFPIVDFIKIIPQTGFNIREIISWFKAYNATNFSGDSTRWGSWRSASNPHLRGLVEVIIVANKGPWRKSSGSGISDITSREFLDWTKSCWFIKAETNRSHPAPYPVELPYRLIKLYTYVNDIILDPFAGSCTTALAAKKTNRRYIMIEISPAYCRLGKDRLRQEYLF